MTNARLTELIARANTLLGDPHPGVMAWNEALDEVVTKIIREYGGGSSEPINMQGGSLTLAMIHRIISLLATEGEAHVVNCEKSGLGHVLHLMSLLRGNASSAAPNWVWLGYVGNLFVIDANQVVSVGFRTQTSSNVLCRGIDEPWIADGSVGEVCLMLGIPVEGQ